MVRRISDRQVASLRSRQLALPGQGRQAIAGRGAKTPALAGTDAERAGEAELRVGTRRAPRSGLKLLPRNCVSSPPAMTLRPGRSRHQDLLAEKTMTVASSGDASDMANDARRATAPLFAAWHAADNDGLPGNLPLVGGFLTEGPGATAGEPCAGSRCVP
jgi:hypothetical protein